MTVPKPVGSSLFFAGVGMVLAATPISIPQPQPVTPILLPQQQ